MKKEIVALALALCLLLGCFGCQSEQKDIYDQFAGSGTSQEESQADESAAPEEETQEDALSGELTISVKFPTSESSGLGMVAAEFEEQHPGVTVTIQPGLQRGHRPVPGGGKELHRSPGGGAHQRGRGGSDRRGQPEL